MDAREQRLGQVVHRLVAEAAPDECADRFVLITLAAGNRHFARHPQPAAKAEHRRPRQGAELQREAEEGSFRNRMQPIVTQDVRRARRQRRHQPIGNAQLAAQGDRSRLLHQQRIGAAVDHPAVESLGGDDAAGARRRFEDPHADAAPLQLERSGQPGDAAADDGDIRTLSFTLRSSRCSVRVQVRSVREALWTYWASICTCSTGVEGRMPWPRLKIWPGLRPTRVRMSSVC